MELTKKDVQKRVLKDGKPLGLKLFEWNEVTRTFESEVEGLVVDFSNIDNVHFKTNSKCKFTTGSYCKFDTGSDCVFNTGWKCVFTTKYNCTFIARSECKFTTGGYCVFRTDNNCTFDTGNCCVFDTNNDCTFNTGIGCTFDTGSSCVFKTGEECVFSTVSDCKFNTDIGCTFVTHHNCEFLVGRDCVIITKPYNEIIKHPFKTKLTTCPLYTPGYLVGSDHYVDGVKQDGKYMIADKLLSKIISKKGNTYKVYIYINHLNNFSTTPTYIAQDGDLFSHGETIEEAHESLIYKIGNRDKSAYENLTIDSVLSKEEAIKMYRVITGACEFGVRMYVESLTNVKDNYSIQEIVELTNDQYGNDVLREFFKI